MQIHQRIADLPGYSILGVRPESGEGFHKKATTKSRHRRSILKSLIYIENNLGQSIKLDDLSTVACLSPFHFHRLFVSFMRETINEYICRRRMEKAALHLSAGNLSITEIGLSNGYSTPAAFAKTFKRFTGQSPSFFKKRTCGLKQERFLLDHIFLRGMQSKDRRYLTDIEPIIRYVPTRYALMIRKKGFYSGSFKRVIWQGLQEVYHYLYLAGLDRFVEAPITTCSRFPKDIDDPEAPISVGVIMNKEIEAEHPFHMVTLDGGRYALYEYYEPARLYKLSWQVYWHWQTLKQGNDFRSPYQMLVRSRDPDLAIFKKVLHVPLEAEKSTSAYGSPGKVRNSILKYQADHLQVT